MWIQEEEEEVALSVLIPVHTGPPFVATHAIRSIVYQPIEEMENLLQIEKKEKEEEEEEEDLLLHTTTTTNKNNNVNNVQPNSELLREAGLPNTPKQIFCANKYTYYEEFFKSAFEIFTANSIYPDDLNLCCNTIVKGPYIRIIDFGRYKFYQHPDEVRKSNKLLETILDDVASAVNNSHTECGK